MTVQRSLFLTAFLSLTATPLLADDVTISMPPDAKVEHIDASYQCGPEKITVTYINAGSVNLARLGIGNTIIVASNVISASGAKYAGGPYVWWSKGEAAEFYDVVKDPQMNAPTHCTTLKN